MIRPDNEPVAIANELKHEADYLLNEKGIGKLLKKYGDILYMGSYAFDLMAWPDIDLRLIPHNKEGVENQLLELAKDFLLYDEVISLKMERGLHLINKRFPKGHYLQIKIQFGKWRLPWKFDIWVISNDLDKDKEYIKTIKSKLNPDLRKFILNIKHRIMTKQGRTPSASGYHLYQAVLFEGIQSEEEIIIYLKNKGIL